jgi:hypothetical protein
MSAWGVGTGRAAALEAVGSGGGFKRFIDKVTVWIPGDVIALYVAGVTLLLEQNSRPSVLFLVIMAIVTPGIVLLGAWAAGRFEPVTRLRALLALIAFLVWSLTVPGSGWQELDFVANNQAGTTIVAGLVGLFFGILAERLAPAS